MTIEVGAILTSRVKVFHGRDLIHRMPAIEIPILLHLMMGGIFSRHSLITQLSGLGGQNLSWKGRFEDLNHLRLYR